MNIDMGLGAACRACRWDKKTAAGLPLAAVFKEHLRALFARVVLVQGS
ncbi:hypothetical protein [Paraburkholderia fungorum]|nr:hypothetical protein [Paraburkholderia fungorum]MBU7443183.1 hypothetical protein [Paraburkholderia fungorum]